MYNKVIDNSKAIYGKLLCMNGVHAMPLAPPTKQLFYFIADAKLRTLWSKINGNIYFISFQMCGRSKQYINMQIQQKHTTTTTTTTTVLRPFVRD